MKSNTVFFTAGVVTDYMTILIRYLFIIITFLLVNPVWAQQLSEEEAFNMRVLVVGTRSVDFVWQIAPKHYLYQNQLQITNTKNKPLLNADNLPTPMTIEDPLLGSYRVYKNNLTIRISRPTKTPEKYIVRYQGCSQDGFCYLPVHKLVSIEDDVVNITDTDMQEFSPEYRADKFADMLEDRFLPVTLMIFFCVGILLSFTPCVLPMIPIVVNLIVGPKSISSRKAFILASSYVLGMALCYTVAGIIAGLLGATLSAWLQKPIILIILSALLVVLALAQFELIHISLPHFNKRLHHWSQKQLQGSYIGAFILGALSALIVSPCITPPLIGALTYIGQSGDPLIGGLALFCLGLGMGVPLIVVAMLSSVILPRAGEWMNAVKTCAGLALLGLAVWLLARILPDYVTVILWGILCIIAAIQFRAFKTLTHAKKSTKALKVFGIILALFGGALVLNTIYMQFFAAKHNVQIQLSWKNINTLDELNAELEKARAKRQVTLLKFYAQWCISCKKMESTVFSDPDVVKALRNFNLLRVDLTKMEPQQKPILEKFNIYGPPVILFFDHQTQELKDKSIIGETDAHKTLQILQTLS